MCKIFQWKTLQSLWLNTFYLTKYKLPIVKSWCCTKEPFETRISFKSFNIWTKCGAKMNWKNIPQNWSFHWDRALITFVVEVTIKVFRPCSGLKGSELIGKFLRNISHFPGGATLYIQWISYANRDGIK